ncbi:MAG: glycerophosphodiester phosphodiesterase family protein [Bdellovibrionales bacterium]|nr:glycerophosphodiester phosphodiesterase family protein [Bdellovibrionales bacterium]
MKKILLIAIAIVFTTTPIFADESSDLLALKDRLSGFKVGAHQGGLFYKTFPNTMKAFEASLDDGADIVEMDLHITKDNVVVVYHDDELKRWTNCKGLVIDKTFEELQKCKFTLYRSSKIPTFEEVLQWAQGRIIVDAEFKDARAINGALDLVNKYRAHSWTYFQTQDNKDKYIEAHTYDPKVALLYAVHSEDDLKWALEQTDELLIVEIDGKMRNPSVIDRIHQSGKLVTEDSWHFSKTQELFRSSCKKGFENKIDILVTNRPDGCVKEREAVR